MRVRVRVCVCGMAALRLLARQVASLRSEEESEGSWFALPYAGDEDVDWARFEVTLCGPATDAGTGAPSPYAAGLFRVRLALPDDFPRAPPTAEFLTRVWHPNVQCVRAAPPTLCTRAHAHARAARLHQCRRHVPPRRPPARPRLSPAAGRAAARAWTSSARRGSLAPRRCATCC